MKKLSLPVIGGVVAGVLVLGAGGAVASGVIGGEVQPTSDESVYVAPSETAAATTDAPAPAPVVVEPTPAPAPVEPPIAEVPAATVGGVTESEPQVPTEPEIVDPESIGTRGEDGHYTPAPPRINPGEPPVAPEPPAPQADPGVPDVPIAGS